MHGWNIYRTRPAPANRGVALPTFIHNGAFHYSTVDAYADGAIDCWGFLDLDLFRTKLKTGWVDPRPRVGAQVNVHNLGGGTVASATWASTPIDLLRQVEGVIESLNPSHENLLDMQGSDVEMRGKVRDAKLGMADEKPCRLDGGDNLVLGKQIPVFARAGDGYQLTHCFVYADGQAQVG